MIDNPTVEELTQAATELKYNPYVEAVDVIDGDARFADRRNTLSIVVGGEFDRVPPRVVRAIADADLGLWSVDRQAGGEAFIIVAV